MEIEKTMLRLEEASKYLGISERYLKNLMHAKKIPYYKPFGKFVYFDKTELDQFLHRSRVSTSAEIAQRANALTM